MSRCPECNSRISPKATMCPHCGFSSPDGATPLGSYLSHRRDIDLVIPEAAVFDNEINLLAKDANSAFVAFLKDAENAAQMFPTIYQLIKDMMARGELKYTADFSKAAEELMKKGELVLGVGKDGSILPQLRDAKTKQVYEMVRLKVDTIPQDLMPSVVSLQLQMTIAQVLTEIRDVAASVEALKLESQADRMAEAESVWLRLQQATKIKDARLREAQLLNIANAATVSRSRLQKNLSVRLSLLDEGSTKAKASNANEALDELAAIVMMSRSEYAAFALLEEQATADECLRQLSEFLLKEHLDDRDLLLEINSQARIKNQGIVDGFHSIAGNVIAALESADSLDLLLEEWDEDGDE